MTTVRSAASALSDPRRLGRVLAGLFALALLVFPLVSDDAYYQNMIILSLVFAIGASGLNIITGFAGYTSLGQGAFVGLGGYTIGVLATRVEGVSPWLWVPVAGIVTAIVAIGLGLVSLRSRGPAFVIITVAFLFLVQVIARNWVELTNGAAGLTLPLPSWDADIINWPFYYALAVILALQLALTWWIRRTKLGMGLVAIREDETKAATIGINLPVQKITGFAASTVFVGMGGAVYGYYLTFIDPLGMFGILISVQIVLSLLLGGRGTLWGPVLGAFLIEPLNEIANNNLGGGNTRLFLFGGTLVLVVIFLPQGILPAIENLLYRKRTEGKAALVGQRVAAGGTLGSPAGRPDTPEGDSDAPLSLTRHEPAAGTHQPLLEVSGLCKRFGGLRAVDDCSFTVAQKTITGLIGPNGSGKTTVFNLMDDTIHADAGEVVFGGERIDRLPSWERAYRGLGRTFQLTRLFGEMTVLENVVAAQREFSWRGLGRVAVSGREAAAAEELLAFVGMHEYRDQKANALSYGQQKLVELAQVLMLDPSLILLDEPAGGINPVLIERIGGLLEDLRSYGKTLLVVEHNMPFVLGLCDTVHVLAQGTVIATGSPLEVRTNPVVIDAYLGEDIRLDRELRSLVNPSPEVP